MMAARSRQRDSIRQVKQAEFEARRQELILKRQRRTDSINGVQQPTNNTPPGPPVIEGDGSRR